MKNNLFLIGLLALSLQTFAQKKFSNELIWNSREFNAEYLGGFNSMNDGETFSDLKDSDLNGLTIIKCSFSTGDTLAEITNAKKIFKGALTSFDNYSFNADETMLLIETDRQSIYRWSSEANYYVHNLQTGETAPIANFANGKQRLATISPDKKRVAFVRNNNIFIF
ncbi:MAG: hypothetical protein RL092_2160, partial [Bacteroidota bacterium]